MQINESAAKFHPIVRADSHSKAANSYRAWRRAKMRLEQAIEAARAFSRAHDEAQKQTIAARRALEGVQIPRSLGVQVSAYLRFKDDLGQDISASPFET
jgi:sortase (surface protein transpeptidase)